MAVAENVDTTRSPMNARLQLGISSLVGGALVLIALWFVFAGLPLLWEEITGVINEFLSGALLLVLSLAVIVALSYFAYHLERSHSIPGLRAGTFVAVLALYVVAWLSISVIGNFLATRELDVLGPAFTIAIGGGLLFLLFLLFKSEGFQDWLHRIEDQGWFHAIPYKPTQGVRVRRGTVLAIIVLGFCGIYTMAHRGIVTDRYGVSEYGVANTWFWNVPFMSPEHAYLPVMFKVNILLPIVLGVLLLWFAWRIVNWPAFSDFLIATEAEMNKVSWTSRKRLVQDTVVVLTTVFLMTVFLFLVDIVWIKVLSWRPIGVLQVDVRTEALKQQEKTQW
ncbi:MAG: preprotein translocase subunit SecE [Planctomycetes bacterium]|nr:preprotein translocase subunit SecE [Planctomycetota bacterium]